MKRSTPILLALAIPLVAVGGCAERDVLYHGFEDGDSSEEEVVDRGGNFPEPALSVCGALPEGVAPIPGLVAAWGVQSTFSSWDGPASYPGIRLRFSDWGFQCDESFPSAEEDCVSTWSYALTLPVDLQPGIYDLTQVSGLGWETHFTVGGPEGCAGGEAGGEGGFAPPSVPGGEIEIFAITDDCIVGEVRHLDEGQIEPDLDPNGGFVAQRCHSACVPTVGASC